MRNTDTVNKVKCYHCGDDCDEQVITSDEKIFVVPDASWFMKFCVKTICVIITA